MRLLGIPVRYLFSRTGRNRSRNVRIFLGLTLSMLVMLTVISVMDYLQNNRFEFIKQVRSFPLTVECDDYQSACDLASEYSDMAYSFVYRTGEGLLRAGSVTAAVNIRYIDDSYRGGLYISGSIPSEGSILLPYALSRGSGSYEAEVTTLERGRVARFTQQSRSYPVSGFYTTSLGSEFDSSMVFLPLSAASDDAPSIAAFLVSADAEAELRALLEADSRGTLVTWQEREGSLYGAMQLERIIMQLLLSSLFLIIMVQSIQNASALAKAKRRESVALLLSGVTRGRLRLLFVLCGEILTLSSAAFGTLLSLVLLKALPQLVGTFRSVVFHLPLSLTLGLVLLLSVISAIIYSLALGSTLRESDVREVINCV